MHFDFIIVGAGVAGLTVAYKLLQTGKKVLIIEHNKRIGGLAKSFAYSFKRKKYIFDIGPKRFHTDDKEVLQFILSILGNRYIVTGRKSSVYLFDRYFNWPIRISDIPKLPIHVQVGIVYDLITKLIIQRSRESNNRFDHYIIEKYGKTLFASFFDGYTKKFLKLSTDRIHSDWAHTSINRSIIDKNSKGYSLFDLLASLLLPLSVKTQFIYPKQGGFGFFTQSLGKEIRKLHGEIVTGFSIEKISANKKTILMHNQYYSYNQLIWTGNINDLSSLLKLPDSKLRYLSTIFYNVVVKNNTKHSNNQWIYYGSESLRMVRASVEKNFAPYLAPKRYDEFVLEITCFFNDEIWNNPAMYIDILKSEMVRTGMVGSMTQIIKIFTERVKDTYPIYSLEYRKNYKHFSSSIRKNFPDIILLGRSGLFWYNNVDHTIKAALQLAHSLVNKKNHFISSENIFSGIT